MIKSQKEKVKRKNCLFFIIVFLVFSLTSNVYCLDKPLSGIWQEYLWGHEKLAVSEDGILIIDQINDANSSVSDCNTFAYLESEPWLIYIDVWGIDEALGRHKRTEKNTEKLRKADYKGLAQSYIIDEKITLNVKKGDVVVLIPESFVDVDGKITEPILNISLNGQPIAENYTLKSRPFMAVPKRMHNIKTQYWDAADKAGFLSSLKEKEDKKIQVKPLKYTPVYETEFFIVDINDNYYLRGIDFGWKAKDVLPETLPPAGMTLHVLFDDSTGQGYAKLAEYITTYKFARVVIGEGYDNFSNKDIPDIVKNISLQLKAIQNVKIPVYIPVWLQQDGSDIALLKKLREEGIQVSGLWIGGLHQKTANFSLPQRRYKNLGSKNYIVGNYLGQIDEEIINKVKAEGYIGICKVYRE